MQKIPDYNDYSKIEENMIHFIEAMSHTDINCSWHHFSLLSEDKTHTFREDGLLKKSRKFQVYYKHKLTYEGLFYWSYPHNSEGKQISEAAVRFEKIRRGADSDLAERTFELSLNMLDYITEDGEELQVEIIELPETLSEYDRSRMHLILEKWGLQGKTIMNFNEIDHDQLEAFIKHLVSAAILVQAGNHPAKLAAKKMLPS